MTKEQEILKMLVDTVEATGGLLVNKNNLITGCAADEDWLDLALAAHLAQQVLTAVGVVVALSMTRKED